MGYENTGILFYGIMLDEQKTPWSDINEGDPDIGASWEQHYLARKGFTEPKPVFSDLVTDREAWHQYDIERRAWLKRRDEALSDAGCIVGIYHSCHDPWSYIALKVAHHEGGCCPPRVMDPNTLLRLPPEADDTIRRFCEHMDVPLQQPRWWLTGLYC